MKWSAFKMPNRLICDDKLQASARAVGAALFAHSNALGHCCKSLRELARLSGRSVTTVHKAVYALEEAGYIQVMKRKRYLSQKGVVGYDKLHYACNLSYSGGFTLIPRQVFRYAHSLTSSAFVSLLYLYQAAGNQKRAFPCIAGIAKAVSIAASTVCAALQDLRRLPILLVRCCRKTSRKMASNSYLLCTDMRTWNPTTLVGADIPNAGPTDTPLAPSGALEGTATQPQIMYFQPESQCRTRHAFGSKPGVGTVPSIS